MSFEERVEQLPKETSKNQMNNCQTINDVADEVVKNFEYFQLKFQALTERVKMLEWKPKISPADENDPQFRKKNIYLGKLNNGEIREPKQSTLDYYNVKYDEREDTYF